jgi:hypothetical protein
MRSLGPCLLIPLVLLLASDTAHTEMREFDADCGLLGNFAQYKTHIQHCKTTEQVKTNIVSSGVNPDKCGPALGRGSVSGVVGNATTNVGGSAGKVGGAL